MINLKYIIITLGENSTINYLKLSEKFKIYKYDSDYFGKIFILQSYKNIKQWIF